MGGSVFARARAFGNLTPFERALLRFVNGVLLSVLLAGLQAIVPLLTAPDPALIAWPAVGRTFLIAVLLALIGAIGKYQSAQGDPPLPPAPTGLSSLSTFTPYTGPLGPVATYPESGVTPPSR